MKKTMGDFGETLSVQELGFDDSVEKFDNYECNPYSSMNGYMEFVKENGVMIVAGFILILGLMALRDKKSKAR